MDVLEKIKAAWRRELKSEIPEQYLTRLECKTGGLSDSTSKDYTIQTLTSVKDKSKDLISQLSRQIKEEEIFLDIVSTELDLTVMSKKKEPEMVNIDSLYAKVNKPKRKNSEPLGLKVQNLSSSSNQDLEFGYEEVQFTNRVSSSSSSSRGSTGSKKSMRGSVKEKIKKFEKEESDSSSSEDSGAFEGDYASIKPTAVVAQPAPVRKPRINEYEEIDLPFLSKPKPPGDVPEVKSEETKTLVTNDTSNGSRNQSVVHNKPEGSGPSIQIEPIHVSDTSSKSPKPNRPPVPIRRGKSQSSKKIDADSLRKVEESTLKQSDQEPQLSSSMKKPVVSNPHHDIKISARAHVIHLDKPIDGEDDDIEGDYCSISDLRLSEHKHPVEGGQANCDGGSGQQHSDGSSKHSDVVRKNITVLTVSCPDKYKSRSTENLSKIDYDGGLDVKHKQYKSKSQDCLNDVGVVESNNVTSDNSTEMKKLFNRKERGNITTEKASCNETHQDTDVATQVKSLSSSGSDEDMMQTVQVDFSKLLDSPREATEEDGKEKKDKRDRVPDYEKWNFQTLLTRNGISVIENDNTDTGSEDDNVYDNVEPPETVSGQSDDSGVCETLTPDAQKRIVHVTAEEDGEPEVSSPVFTTDSDSRHSNASCLTIDGGSQFLLRSDSNASSLYPMTTLSADDEDRIASIDEDNFSVCSLDDQLDKNDFEETLRPDEDSKQRSEQLHMRHLVVKGILESERSYLHVVDQLIKAKHYLQTSCLKPGSGISLEDVTTIFYKLEDIAKIHQEFIGELEEKVKCWTDDECIAEAVKRLVVYFKAYEEYVSNYPTAIATIHKYQRNEDTKHLLEKVFASRLRSNSITSALSSISGFTSKGFNEQIDGYKDDNVKLEDILLKPVQRIQTNNLVLHDLIKHTPEDHPDYLPLKKALKLSELNLKVYNEQSNVSPNMDPEARHLVKSGFIVEVSRDKKNSRQLRYVFLFSDILVCTKHKGSSKHKEVSFKHNWSLPLPTMAIHLKDEKKYASKESLDELKNKIGTFKCELRDEMRKADDLSEGLKFITKSRVHRNIEKLKKKIQEQEATLVEALPRLPLNLQAENFRPHTFLFATDYEREEWREALESQKMKCSGMTPPQLSTHDLEVLIESTKLHTQVNGIGTVLLKKDEEMLNGTLNVTIHKMHELDVITSKLDDSCEVYCCLEMDSFGHFYKQAQTRLSKYLTDASWDQDFELDLDGSQTLRILCYKKMAEGEDDVIIGKCALELSLAWLNSKFNEKTISMNEVSITISIRHTPASKTLKRTQSKLRTGIFGVKIENVVRREGLTVPSIVTTCVKQVEERGLEEVGVYRVSGVTSEVQHLKKLFDKNPIAAGSVAKETDIHAITGVLKLYFRELPEPLFTDHHYQSFIQTIALQNEEAKEKCMLELLHSLPDGNYYTIIYMIEHLMRIAQHASVNKMSINNLATIFGPTLLHPATKETSQDPIMQMVQAAKDASVQCEVVQFFIRLAMKGKNLRKSAMTEESSSL